MSRALYNSFLQTGKLPNGFNTNMPSGSRIYRPQGSNSLFFGGGVKGKDGGINQNGNTIVTNYPGSGFINPARLTKTAPIQAASQDGKTQQYTILAVPTAKEIKAGRYSGIAIQQNLSGGFSFIGCMVDPSTGEPVISASVSSQNPGFVARFGSTFRAFGDSIKIFAYAQDTVSSELVIHIIQQQLDSFVQPVRFDTNNGAVLIPFFATHVSVNTIAGNIEFRDSAGAAIDIVVTPVPGTEYLIPPNAASVINTGAAGLYVFGFRIFGAN